MLQSASPMLGPDGTGPQVKTALPPLLGAAPEPCRRTKLVPLVALLTLSVLMPALVLKSTGLGSAPVQFSTFPFCEHCAATGETPARTMTANASPDAVARARTAEDAATRFGKRAAQTQAVHAVAARCCSRADRLVWSGTSCSLALKKTAPVAP